MIVESIIFLYHHLPLIVIKGCIQTRDVELEDETHKKYVEVIAEKVTFLSSKKADSAQRAGNYEAMKEYDRQIKILQNEKMEMFQSIINSEKEEDKPKVK